MSRSEENRVLSLSDPQTLGAPLDEASRTGNDAAEALRLNLTRTEFSKSSPTGRGEPLLSVEAPNGAAELGGGTNLTLSEAATPVNVAKNISIGPQHFDLLKLIGEGAFGKVIMVRNRLNQKLYAMKVISKKLLRKKNNISYMKSERDILTKVYHPFIVRLWFAFQTEQRLFLVMDFLGGGELFYHLKRRGLILEAEARIYLAEMVLAIEFLHSIGVVHRDLKPENVLLRPNGHICITDFGLAKEVGDNTQVRTLCGTSEYMAPEMLLRNGYTKAVDWWSLGALFYEMLAGKPPFVMKKGESGKDLDRKIISQKVVMPSYLQADTVTLLRGLLEKDSMKRLGSSKSTMFVIGGVTALKAEPFFKGIDWKKVYNCELTPPIDPIAVVYEGMASPNGAKPSGLNTPGKGTGSTPGGRNGGQSTPGKGQQGGPAPAAAAAAGTSAAPQVDTDSHRHFHIEFTNRPLSPSVIEDALSENVSEAATPVLSRSGSKENLATLDAEEKDRVLREKELAAYGDFTYVDASFECTQEQVESFHTDLADKLAKAAEKKKKLVRKEEAKAVKEREEQAALLIIEQANDKLKKEKEAAIAAEQAKAEQLGRWRERMNQLKRTKDACAAYVQNLDEKKQKSKAAARKLRAVMELQGRIDSGELTRKDLSADQKDKLSRRVSLEESVVEEEGGLKALQEKHDIAYAGKLDLTAEEEEEIVELEKRVSGGVNFVLEIQTSQPAPSPAPAPAPASAPAPAPASAPAPAPAPTPPAASLQAEIDRDIEKRRSEMLLQREAFDQAQEAKEARKKAEKDSLAVQAAAQAAQAVQELQATERATSVFGKASLTPPTSPKVGAPVAMVSPEPSVQKYIPIHLRANAGAVQTAAFTSSGSSLTASSSAAPPFVPRSSLAGGSVWGRAAISGSKPLSAYKDVAPVSAPTREALPDDSFSSAVSSSTGSPTNYFSTHSSPVSTTALTVASKEFVPTFQRPPAPTLQPVPVMQQQKSDASANEPPTALPPQAPPAAPVLSWAAKMSMSSKK